MDLVETDGRMGHGPKKKLLNLGTDTVRSFFSNNECFGGFITLFEILIFNNEKQNKSWDMGSTKAICSLTASCYE